MTPLLVTGEKLEPKAYVRCTTKELQAWRAKFGRRAVAEARRALINLSIAGGPSPLLYSKMKVPPGKTDNIMTIRMTESERWLVRAVFKPRGCKGRPGRELYAPYIRYHMNRISGYKHETKEKEE